MSISSNANINKDYKWYKDNQLLIPNDRVEIQKDTIK